MKKVSPIAFVCLNLILSSCLDMKSNHDTDQGRLDVYSNEKITAAQGLGAIKLGDKKIGDFVEEFGSGRASMLTGDDFGFELAFRNDQVTFLFVAEGECDRKIRFATSRIRPMMSHGLSQFFETFPVCKNMSLHSISLRAGKDIDSTFFKGATIDGVKLFDSFEHMLGHTPNSLDASPQFLAGSMPNTELQTYRTSGLWFEHDHLGADPKTVLIRRIAIFRNHSDDSKY